MTVNSEVLMIPTSLAPWEVACCFAESTAACLAFQKAIENAGSLDATKVRDALAGLDVMTFFGQIKFDSRGINTFKPMVVEQIQNGAHYTVFPANVANGKPQYPTPSWSSR